MRPVDDRRGSIVGRVGVLLALGVTAGVTLAEVDIAAARGGGPYLSSGDDSSIIASINSVMSAHKSPKSILFADLF